MGFLPLAINDERLIDAPIYYTYLYLWWKQKQIFFFVLFFGPSNMFHRKKWLPCCWLGELNNFGWAMIEKKKYPTMVGQRFQTWEQLQIPPTKAFIVDLNHSLWKKYRALRHTTHLKLVSWKDIQCYGAGSRFRRESRTGLCALCRYPFTFASDECISPSSSSSISLDWVACLKFYKRAVAWLWLWSLLISCHFILCLDPNVLSRNMLMWSLVH